ncbi:MAG: YesL family protein [Lachnospiraceae bacterium]
MNKFFQPENPVIRFLSCFCDLMFTNALFIICCLPVFTIGASVTAMYHVIFKLQDREDSYIYKMFFESFRNNFKQATIIWIPFLLLTGFFAGDLYIIYNVIDASYSWMQFPIWFLLIILFCIQIYAFPQIAKFESDMKRLILNSFLLAIGNFPTTIFFTFIPIAITYFAAQNGKRMIMIGSLFLFFGFAAIAYLYAMFFNRIFERCMPKEKLSKEDMSNEEMLYDQSERLEQEL